MTPTTPSGGLADELATHNWNDCYKYREAVIAALRSQGWQPIETAPKDGSSILVCSGNWIVTAHWHQMANAWMTCGPSYERLPHDEQPTHYMRLPSPPATTKEPE